MNGGNTGRILRVDLTAGEVREERPDQRLYRKYLGGYGLGARLIFSRQPGGVDPLGPDNTLAFTSGPLVGTQAVTGCRFTVCAKSPLTGTWGDANCGGYFGPALKMAGYDAVLFTGASARPVYLYVGEEGPMLAPAADVWGRDTFETETALRQRHGQGTQVASIGPAGERLSLIAAIVNDYGRAAGRSGLGAVMGSKRLKAIAARGAGPVPVADPRKLQELRSRHTAEMNANPRTQHFRKYGTIDHVASSAFSNDSPVRNWAMAGVDFPSATRISDDALLAYQFRKYACWRCSIACGGFFRVPDGPYKTEEAHKPEYETSAMFGNNLLNDNPESLIKINDICNRYGLDTISAGATVAWATECFENRLLTAEETGGLELRWGDHAAIVKAVELLARGEGPLGRLLEKGSAAAASALGKGSERFAIHVGGQELPAHDPKYAPSWGTYYVGDATPGRHTQIGLVTYETRGGLPGLELPVKIERHAYAGKGVHAARVQNIMHAIYCCGVCMFAVQRLQVHAWPEFLSAAVGEPFTVDDLEAIGHRVAALRMAFNAREGVVPRDSFRLPGRARGEPALDKGPLAGINIDVETMRREYFAAQGWDERGWPTEETLRRAGLGDVADELYGG